MTHWKAGGVTDLPVLKDEDREWDGDTAREQIFTWAGGEDDFDHEKAQKGFFAYDADEPENQTSYKLPYVYIVDGEPQAVTEGIYAVAQVLEGARGGVDLPDDVISEIRSKVEKYYEKMDEEAPWE